MSGSLRFHWYVPTHGDTTTIADNRGSATARAGSHLEPTLHNLTALGRAAEDFGFEAVLTPTGSHCEDSWIATAALAQHTRRLKYLVAFRPGVLSPTLAANRSVPADRAGIWSEPDFSFHGEFYAVDHARTASPLTEVPTIYFGGSSPEAFELAAEYADVYLT